jgi:anti-anti-sigma factor
MDIKLVGSDNGLIRLEVVGKLSRDGAAVGRDVLALLCGNDVYSKKVLLNLQRSLYVDSTGVEWLLSYHKRFDAGGGKMICHSPSPVTSQMMKIMRLDRVLNVAATEGEAITKVMGEKLNDERNDSAG